MKFITSCLCLTLLAGSVSAEEYSLKEIKTAPAKLAKPLAAELAATGVEVGNGKKTFCRIWLRKAVPVKKDFAADFMVKYPFQSGTMIGVMEVPKEAKVKDFRGQEMKPGLYTLRYGQQPQDGNHIGTSETSDFILALPAGEQDKSPEQVKSEDDLFQKSAKSVGSTHPAIFSLQAAEKAPEKATLVHDEDNELHVLHTTVTSSEKKSVPLKMVVVGQGIE